jgi:hypothetical protein
MGRIRRHLGGRAQGLCRMKQNPDPWKEIDPNGVGHTEGGRSLQEGKRKEARRAVRTISLAVLIHVIHTRLLRCSRSNGLRKKPSS